MLPIAQGGSSGREFSLWNTPLSEWKEEYQRGPCVCTCVHVCQWVITCSPGSPDTMLSTGVKGMTKAPSLLFLVLLRVYWL